MFKNLFKVLHPGLFLLLLLFACSPSADSTKETEASVFMERIIKNPSDYYFVDFSENKKNVSAASPIGVFDSGTGGLTVLDAILSFDMYDSTQKVYSRGDGVNDFQNESFIYYGDQANMPYGNYPAMGKTDFLKELILRDALFLLGNKAYNSATDSLWHTEKNPVKLVVVACNTATAYGKEDIENLLSEVNCDTRVIGVIDAGVRGALSTFTKEDDGTAAVIATDGTVKSNGYLNTFLSQKSALGFTGDYEFIQQSGIGIAEAIDEEPGFIDRNAKTIRKNYKGPSLTSQEWRIHEDLLSVYNFDTLNNALLFEKEGGKYSEIQLNSSENYIKYHLVNLCEQLKTKKVKTPLKTLILGCTHYPFYSSFFQQTLNELRNLNINGNYIYRDYLSDSITLVDPALNTAREVHEYLKDKNLLYTGQKVKHNQFFISVPDLLQNNPDTISTLNFSYDYKYSRSVNHVYDTKQVPMSSKTVNKEVLKRIELQMPEIYNMISKN